ncbi:pyridoxal phosphate-dependent aminotransferase [Winogradskya humida]|uniref:Aminotransferase n=1 Tax=Winogradskya humida TaxID=113566 RepID=A0ABQ3ZX90_9ACTN|nr:pyridoxal phosphate-dependent aminotransferase [Actinoplanes humidus]GIE23222.1 aminotransferase [Actinoplanes humidus]
MTRDELLALAGRSGYPVLDLSLGVPADPPPRVQPGPPARAGGYPPSAGTAELRAAAAGYLWRQFGVRAAADSIAACAGAKEFVAGLPQHLRRLRADDHRDIVLIPGLCYPTYAFGAELAGLRAYRMPMGPDLRMRPSELAPDIAARALMVWVTSPGNPTGVCEDLPALAAWGRAHDVLVASDEAYAETTWTGPPRTILTGAGHGVLAVHSLAKRNNAPGLRAGFYAGDPGLVRALVRSRRDAGLMASTASQDAAAQLLADDDLAAGQRDRNQARVDGLVKALRDNGFPCSPPDGGLFVWLDVTNGAAFARELATQAGVVVMPGAAYGPAGTAFVRIAAVHDPAVVACRLALLKLKEKV